MMAVFRIIVVIACMSKIQLCNAEEVRNVFSSSQTLLESRNQQQEEQNSCSKFDTFLANKIPNYANHCDCSYSLLVGCSIPDLCLNTTTTEYSTTTIATSNVTITTISVEHAGSNTQGSDSISSRGSTACAKLDTFEIDLIKTADSKARVHNCLLFEKFDGIEEEFCIDFVLGKDESWQCNNAVYEGSTCFCDVCEDRMSVTIDCSANANNSRNRIAMQQANVTCQPFLEFAPFIPNFTIAKYGTSNTKAPATATGSGNKKNETLDYSKEGIADKIDEGVNCSKSLFDSDKKAIFQSAFGTAVPILALLLIFEKIRGGLDQALLNRPVYSAMANLFYREMATLALLQLLIDLIMESGSFQLLNHPLFNKVQRTVVLVALLDFIQTAALYYFSNLMSAHVWRDLEDYDIHHYHEVRDEFDQMDQCLYGNRSVKRINCWINDSNVLLDGSPYSSWTKGLWIWIRHPILRRKHHRLLAVLQYHAIRVNMISMNDLPPNFRVTSYFRKSLQATFIDMIENSNKKWLFLICVQSCLYFGMGLIADITKKKDYTKKVIYYGIYVSVVLITLFGIGIIWKINYIYRKTMRIELLWGILSEDTDTKGDDTSLSTSGRPSRSASQQRCDYKQLRKEQLELFWFGKPKIIMTALKLNHYSYAVTLAIVFIFSVELLENSLGRYQDVYVLIAVQLFYLITMSITIPYYTIINGLGKLINKEILRETVALHHLKEMHQSRAEQHNKETNDKLFTESFTRKDALVEFHAMKSGNFLGDILHKMKSTRSMMRASTEANGRNESVPWAGLNAFINDNKEHKHRRKSFAYTYADKSSFGDELGDYTSKIGNQLNFFHEGYSRKLHSYFKSLKYLLRGYLVSKWYVRVSSVWGTLTCMTIASIRLEAFISLQKIWQLANTTTERMRITFWAQTAFLVFFTLESILVLSYFPIFTSKNKGLLIKGYAAVFDIMINVSCLILLMVSEILRCDCVGTDIGTVTCKLDPYSLKSLERPSKCCEFGTRTCAGLIEPFTVIVVLRAFRFLVAKRYVNSRKKEKSRFKLAVTAIGGNDEDDGSLSDASTDSGEHKQYHAGSCLGSKTGLFVNLWKIAVSKSPYIAEKYGEFSKEMLQTMLGVDILGENNAQVGAANYLFGKNRTSLSCAYENISPRAMEIIIAGKEGKAVKNIKKLDDDYTRKQNGEYFDVLFEIDDDSIQDMESYESIASLSYPNSNLVLGMRRCQRKFSPLLDTWSMVDVVFTKDEIIYFDVKSDGRHQDEFIIEAIKATSGGLGLRICDVAIGRKILGIIPIKVVTKVWVETKTKPTTEIKEPESGDLEFIPENAIGNDEFWEGQKMDDGKFPVLKTRTWEASEQDCLQVRTKQMNVLYLQFISDHHDFFDEDIHDYNDGHGNSCAFTWARMIGSICSESMGSNSDKYFQRQNREQGESTLYAESVRSIHKKY